MRFGSDFGRFLDPLGGGINVAQWFVFGQKNYLPDGVWGFSARLDHIIRLCSRHMFLANPDGTRQFLRLKMGLLFDASHGPILCFCLQTFI